MSRESAMAIATGSPAPTAPVVTAQPPTDVISEPTQSAQVLDSTRFSQLTKKESEIQRQRETLKSEQTQFMTERQKYAEIQKQIDSFNEVKSKDPVAALKILGFSEKDLFNFIAAQEDTSTPEERASKAAQSEIQKFKDEQKAEADARQQQVNHQVLGKFRSDIAETISKDPDKYEYCNYNGPLAADLIEETVIAVLEDDQKTDPKALPISVQEAIEMVEQYYEDEDKAMSTLKKRNPTPQAPVKEEPMKPQVSPRPTNQARPTLTNKSNTVASTTPPPLKETSDQKKARLIAKYIPKS